jgi:serine/threonine protein kinase
MIPGETKCSTEMLLTAGARLGPYEILGPLGSGGMGDVYRARDTRLDRIVAIKVLRTHVAADPDRRQRFEREARVISQLNHPHICVLFDVGREVDVDYLVMEYLEGHTLAAQLDLGSKNGTTIGGKRLTGGVALRDGDQIHVGPVVVIFHASASGISTETVSRQ